MHLAHQLPILVDVGLIRAGDEVHAQRLIVEVGLEPGILEVLVQRVELMHGIRPELRRAVELRGDPTQQVAVFHREPDAPLRRRRCSDAAATAR